MLKRILFALIVVFAVFLGIVAIQPAEFHISRSLTMKAPPQEVFAQVNELKAWEAWSPWAKLDPNAKGSYEGPAAGEGAVMRWDGNHQVGKGSMTITETRPGEFIRFRLDFEKPFEATSTAEFTFAPQDGQTLVTWSMRGRNDFLGKAIGLVMDCNKMVGEQFEKGLAQLKAVVEAAPGR